MILLDTHALVWAAIEPRRLSRAAASAMRRARHDDGLAIAAISLWELASLFARRRIESYGSVERSVRDVLQAVGVSIRELTLEIAVLASQLPDDYPRDPADRLIGATALADGVPLITHDLQIRQSTAVKTIW